jgi:P27 family predicted phage terminase small subunit
LGAALFCVNQESKMGMTGRRPKPTALRMITGTKGAPHLGQREPKPKAGIPAKPWPLSPEADKFWDYLVPILKGMQVLTTSDGVGVANFAQALADMQSARAALAGKGLTYESEGGLLKGNPAFVQVMKLDNTVRQYLNEFGMTPAARARLNVEKSDDDGAEDPAEEHFG